VSLCSQLKAIEANRPLHDRANRRLLACTVLSVFLILPAGCAAPLRLKAVPSEATTHAQIPELAGVRYIVPENGEEFAEDAARSGLAELEALADAGWTGDDPPSASFLAVSGGGDKGAFAAGLLCGWTELGDRPEFKAVTGISTGALIAPFAFLGPRYDHVLREFYTGVTSREVLTPRSILSGLLGDAMADSGPLRKLVSRTVTPDLLARIAAEHAKGRVLLVGTTNLDARRAVIWNMTKIAASRGADRLKLFQDILIASASVPGAFPPVMIDVEVDGKRYQEMHVDGGTMAQVFVYPGSFQPRETASQIKTQLRAEGADSMVEQVARLAERDRTLYIIRNSKLAPEWSEVERRTLSIAGRAISSLIQTQGVGDLYQLYLITQRDGLNFRLAYIPDDFEHPRTEEFDKAYMNALFEAGYERAQKGYRWETSPPRLSAVSDDR
jgi:predicted acylesterase/phospholipase RssA